MMPDIQSCPRDCYLTRVLFGECNKVINRIKRAVFGNYKNGRICAPIGNRFHVSDVILGFFRIHYRLGNEVGNII